MFEIIASFIRNTWKVFALLFPYFHGTILQFFPHIFMEPFFSFFVFFSFSFGWLAKYLVSKSERSVHWICMWHCHIIEFDLCDHLCTDFKEWNYCYTLGFGFMLWVPFVKGWGKGLREGVGSRQGVWSSEVHCFLVKKIVQPEIK